MKKSITTEEELFGLCSLSLPYAVISLPALDNFMAGLCWGSDLGLSHTPWEFGSVKWKVPSALQIHLRTSQKLTNGGALPRISYILTLTLARQVGSTADSCFLCFVLFIFFPVEHSNRSIRNCWHFPWSLHRGHLFKSPFTLFAHYCQISFSRGNCLLAP